MQFVKLPANWWRDCEMPGIYTKDKFDLAGFSVGIVSKRKIIGKNNVRENNIIFGDTIKWSAL